MRNTRQQVEHGGTSLKQNTSTQSVDQVDQVDHGAPHGWPISRRHSNWALPRFQFTAPGENATHFTPQWWPCCFSTWRQSVGVGCHVGFLSPPASKNVVLMKQLTSSFKKRKVRTNCHEKKHVQVFLIFSSSFKKNPSALPQVLE